MLLEIEKSISKQVTGECLNQFFRRLVLGPSNHLFERPLFDYATVIEHQEVVAKLTNGGEVMTDN